MTADRNQDSITVLVDEPLDLQGARGFGATVEEVVRRVGQLSVDTLADNLRALCTGMSAALKSIELPDLPYGLEEVELTVDLTASGEVRLVGSVGAELAGGIKLVFRRR